MFLFCVERRLKAKNRRRVDGFCFVLAASLYNQKKLVSHFSLLCNLIKLQVILAKSTKLREC